MSSARGALSSSKHAPHVLRQRDGYFYVTQGEKTLVNQTHAGVCQAPPHVCA